MCAVLSLPVSAESVTFSQAWQMVQSDNNGLAASQANVSRYQNLQAGKKSLNLPSVTLSANYTRLDDDVTLDGNQLVESTGNTAPPVLAPILGG